MWIVVASTTSCRCSSREQWAPRATHKWSSHTWLNLTGFWEAKKLMNNVQFRQFLKWSAGKGDARLHAQELPIPDSAYHPVGSFGEFCILFWHYFSIISEIWRLLHIHCWDSQPVLGRCHRLSGAPEHDGTVTKGTFSLFRTNFRTCIFVDRSFARIE